MSSPRPQLLAITPAVALSLGAVGFAGIGLALLAAPDLLRLVDVPAATSTARSDLRAVFGGLELGFGAFLLLAVRRPTWHGPALAAECLTLGGVVLGRLTSLALDGSPRPITFVLAAAEALGAALAGAALRTRRAGVAPRAS